MAALPRNGPYFGASVLPLQQILRIYSRTAS